MGLSSKNENAQDAKPLALYLVSLLFIVMGVAIFAYFIYLITEDDDIRQAREGLDYEGVGADVELVVPEPVGPKEPEFALDITNNSLAEELGFERRNERTRPYYDVLWEVQGQRFDATQLSWIEAQQKLINIYNNAVDQGRESVIVVVDRAGERESLRIPLNDFGYIFRIVPQEPPPPPGLELNTSDLSMVVTRLSPAKLAGFENGDILLAVRSRDTEIAAGRRAPSDLQTVFNNLSEGATVSVWVQRVDQEVEIEITSDQFAYFFNLQVEDVGAGLDFLLLDAQYYQLNIEEGSFADTAGLENRDLVLAIEDLELDVEETGFSSRDVRMAFASAFDEAQAADESTIEVRIIRDGEQQTVEMTIPDPETHSYPLAAEDSEYDIENEGLSVETLDEADERNVTPRYILIPQENSPAERFRVEEGDILTQVGDTLVTAATPREEVLSLLRDEGVPEEEDDYAVSLVVLRPSIQNPSQLSERNLNVIKDSAPDLVLGFLMNFGIIVPLLAVFVGINLILLGLKMLRVDVTAARWAEVALIWLIVGIVLVAIREYYVGGRGDTAASDQPFEYGDAILSAVPWLLFIIPLGLALYWLSKTKLNWIGDESLTTRNTRFAWNLLIPTLGVLIFVAARPLEQTVVSSFTDEIFGSAKPSEYIGLDNYERLLSFKLAVVECVPAREDIPAFVVNVQPDSPAAIEGLQTFDVIQRIGSTEIDASEMSEEDIDQIFLEESQQAEAEARAAANGDPSQIVPASVEVEVLRLEEVARVRGQVTVTNNEEINASELVVDLTDPLVRTTTDAIVLPRLNYNALGFTVSKQTRPRELDECKETTGAQPEIVWKTTDDERAGAETRYRTATTWQIPGSDDGLKILGRDDQFINSLGNTLQFTIASVILELILGMIVALIVNAQFSGKGVMRTAMLVPWAIPTVVAATLWRLMLRSDSAGLINKVGMDLGFIDSPTAWLTQLGPWMNSIIMVDVWKTVPFMALLLLAGLQTIPKDIYEAASVDGASKVRQFFSVTLPLLRPTIAVALIFRTLDALRAFDVFFVLLADPRRPSLATYNHNRLLAQEGGYASAVGVIIFILIFIFSVAYMSLVQIEQE